MWGRLLSEGWRLALVVVLGMAFFGLRVTGEGGETAPGEGLTVETIPVSDDWLRIDFVLGLLVFGLVPLRRRMPLTIAVVTTLFATFSSLAAPANLLCLASLATRRRRRDLYVLAPLFIAVSQVGEVLWPSNPASTRLVAALLAALASAVVFAATWSIGAYIGARRELVSTLREKADTLEREQTLRIAQAKTSERARIAQEMHDVLAHRISLIAVHANVLSYRDDLTREEMAEHAGVVRENADRAVSELAGVLGVLRGGEGADNAAPPQPTLDRLAELIHDAKRAGAPVAIVGAMPDLDDLPVGTSRTAYRIVQECLTNARKHAAGLPVTVSIGGAEGERLEILVKNPLSPTGEPADEPVVKGAGMGLLGLAERVQLAGGTFDSGAEDGFFVVRARLPWTPR